MKKFFTMLICLASLFARAQFVEQPLNYPGPGYWPYYISIADPEHVWVGTIHEDGIPCSWAVHTADGGNSWILDTIPVPGLPVCSSIASVDSGTCFYVFTDAAAGGGSIWKTTDQGETWTNLTTTQFSGGFANFYHPFTADTGVAMGDPVDGYFEIQVTCNGGATWQRVPESQIPPPLTGEYGYMDCYSAVGNSVWFTTNKGRCYKSTDRGLNWAVTQVFVADDDMFNVCFSTGEKGIYWCMYSDYFAVTTDGGATWQTKTFLPGCLIMNMSRVGGFDEGYVVTAWKNYTDVYFTSDMFESYQILAQSIISSGEVSFLDATTGWLSGGESGINEIYKYAGVLTSSENTVKVPESLSILPNPSCNIAWVQLPQNREGCPLEIRIYGITGIMIDRMPVASSDDCITLNATAYQNGLYLVQLVNGSKIQASRKWIVAH